MAATRSDVLTGKFLGESFARKASANPAIVTTANKFLGEDGFGYFIADASTSFNITKLLYADVSAVSKISYTDINTLTKILWTNL